MPAASDDLASLYEGTVSKKVLYIGGLPQNITTADLYSLCGVFGDLTTVTLPMDATNQHHRGFAFVEFDDADDAYHCKLNLHQSELYNHVLSVSYAKPTTLKMNGVWTMQDSLNGADDEQQPGADQEMTNGIEVGE